MRVAIAAVAIAAVAIAAAAVAVGTIPAATIPAVASMVNILVQLLDLVRLIGDNLLQASDL
jgi:hypothetical protein